MLRMFAGETRRKSKMHYALGECKNSSEKKTSSTTRTSENCQVKKFTPLCHRRPLRRRRQHFTIFTAIIITAAAAAESEIRLATAAAAEPEIRLVTDVVVSAVLEHVVQHFKVKGVCLHTIPISMATCSVEEGIHRDDKRLWSLQHGQHGRLRDRRERHSTAADK